MSRAWATIPAACLLWGSGCVLAEPADHFPFEPTFTITDSNNTTPNNTSPNNSTPAPPPRLVFTEILIDAPGADPFVVERGEYIEIRNVGQGSADPRGITLILSDLDELVPVARIEVGIPFSEEEHAAVAALTPIEPGGYFVFLRYDVPEVVPVSEVVDPGALYDFGRYANGPTLPHQEIQRRRLDLGYRYPTGETETFDSIQWGARELQSLDGSSSLPFDTGLALAVDETAEDPDANDDIANWCVPREVIGEVNGTPGASTACP